MTPEHTDQELRLRKTKEDGTTTSIASDSSNAPELPPFTLKNVLGDIKNGVFAVLYDPFCNRIVGPLVVSFTAILVKVVIGLVSYTEIDFRTYMQQIDVANSGELDYTLITGDTGPCVYPAGYIQIYQFISAITDGGTNINLAQSLFGYLLTFTNMLAVVSYTSIAGIQPWPMMFLLASKRLVSIYVLRLFNDCFTTISMVGVFVLLQQSAYWYSTSELVSFLLTIVAADLYSVAISIKMNAVLYMPGFLIVTYFLTGEHLLKYVVVLVTIPVVQVLMGWKYLLPFFDGPEASLIRWNYIGQAFDFSRQFLYKWTVNWRFVSEEFFLSREFATILLAGHMFVLTAYILTRYLDPRVIGKSLPVLIIEAFSFKKTISKTNLIVNCEKGPRLVFAILATSNVIGVLFARSLHYQFLSWYCWQLPALLYLTNWGLVASSMVWTVHELCWNTYPSTPLSSGLLVFILVAVLGGVWYSPFWFDGYVEDERKKKRAQLLKNL